MSITSNLSFIAIDVETANADMASICQIGIVEYKEGFLSRQWVTYIDPEDDFDGINISIHGIDEEIVKGAPTFEQIADSLRSIIDGKVVVCHTHFDRLAISQAYESYGREEPSCQWLDSARVARRAWEQFARTGYGLAPVSAMLGYEFKHHDALEDAKACAHILIRACEVKNLDIDGWLIQVTHRITPRSRIDIRREGNQDGDFAGEVLVFTGALKITRQDAADLAASIGFQVATSVTKKTNILVVGDQDIHKLAGHEKSSKHRKVEELIAAGASIRIIGETDFKALVRQSQKN